MWTKVILALRWLHFPYDRQQVFQADLFGEMGKSNVDDEIQLRGEMICAKKMEQKRLQMLESQWLIGTAWLIQ